MATPITRNTLLWEFRNRYILAPCGFGRDLKLDWNIYGFALDPKGEGYYLLNLLDGESIITDPAPLSVLLARLSEVEAELLLPSEAVDIAFRRGHPLKSVPSHGFYRDGKAVDVDFEGESLTQEDCTIHHYDGSVAYLNWPLANAQKVTRAALEEIKKLHQKLYRVKVTTEKVAKGCTINKTEVLDFLLGEIDEIDKALQILWGFNQDPKMLIHWAQIPGCLCTHTPGSERIYEEDCPIHGHLIPHKLHIDSTTMLISGFTDDEFALYYAGAKTLVLKGEFTPEIRDLYDQWAKACGFDDTQKLLCMSTAFPQRLLLSLLEEI